MSNHARRSVAQPSSYKDFNEMGQKTDIPTGMGLNQAALMEQNNSDESRDASVGEFSGKSETNVNRSSNDVMHDSQNSSYTSESEDHDHDKYHKHGQMHMHAHELEGNTTGDGFGKNSKPAKTKHKDKGRQIYHSSDSEICFNTYNGVKISGAKHDQDTCSGGDDAFTFAVDPDEDDLDFDNVNNTNNATRGANLTGTIKEKTSNTAKTPKKNSSNVTKVGKTPNKTPKKKLTVTAKLLHMATPINTPRTEPVPLYNQERLFLEREKASRDVEAAKQMLLHSQREAELAKKRLQEQEAKCKAVHNKKVEKNRNNKHEESRYARTSNICKDTGARSTQINEIPHSLFENQDKETTLEAKLQKVKNNAKLLNPLCRARKLCTNIDGSNNPNIPGMDNGLNAWIDAELNLESMDRDLRYDSRYAKRNSDNSGSHDIDDIPVRGPPRVERIPKSISMEQATETANRLMEETDLFLCRKMGMMRAREPVPVPRRKPTSTVT